MSLQWQWPMRFLGRRLYPYGYGFSPRAAALPGSQLTIKEGDCTAASVCAASAAVAVLQANSFVRIRMTPCLLAVLEASSNFALMAARYGAGSSRRQKSKQRARSVLNALARARLRSRTSLC